jgi:endogenous inhibitor of DNA gyrase (YacG/DUF329 family)
VPYVVPGTRTNGFQMAELICPTCRRKTPYAELAEIPYRPFCSLRCQMIDLGKWLNEEYRISEPLDGATDLSLENPSSPTG